MPDSARTWSVIITSVTKPACAVSSTTCTYVVMSRPSPSRRRSAPSARWASRSLVAASSASGSGSLDPHLSCAATCETNTRPARLARSVLNFMVSLSLDGSGGFHHGRTWRAAWARPSVLLNHQARIHELSMCSNDPKGKVTAAMGSRLCARARGPSRSKVGRPGSQARCGQVGAPAEIPARVDRSGDAT